jgi:hypothetical protein
LRGLGDQAARSIEAAQTSGVTYDDIAGNSTLQWAREPGVPLPTRDALND